MIASFAIVPIGAGEELRKHVAALVPLIEASGLDYRMGAMQTTIEGEPDAVFSLIRKCHGRMRELAPRVLTTVIIDDREGAAGRISGKVADVERELGRKVRHE